MHSVMRVASPMREALLCDPREDFGRMFIFSLGFISFLNNVRLIGVAQRRKLGCRKWISLVPRWEWRRLKIGGGNLIYTKSKVCILDLQMSADLNGNLSRYSEFQNILD